MEMREPVRSLFGDLLDAVLPARCPGCGRLGALVCDACAATLAPAPLVPAPAPVAWWTACFAYQGVARELVARAKYRDERRFLVLVARELACAIERAPARLELVTWAPASAQRIRARGVDHGELLARAVARLVGFPVAPCLGREPGAPQTGLDASARRAGPNLWATRRVSGAVLVIDDVATTGGTLAAAARALSQVGASEVLAATIARTPRPGARSQPAAYTPPTPTAHPTAEAAANSVGSRARHSMHSMGSTWTSSSSEST